MRFELTLLHTAIVLYGIAAAAYAVSFLARAPVPRKLATVLAWGGVACQVTMLFLRGLAADHVPLVSMYEYLNAFAAMVVLSYLVFQWKQTAWQQGAEAAGTLAVLLAVGLLIYAGRLPFQLKQTEPLMPVLRSYWLVFHVSMAVVGYGAAGLASALACLYFVTHRWGGQSTWISDRLPAAPVLDRSVYRAVRFAFPFLTLVNVTGAIWAYYAWGRYWGWDPKETWSLITWLVYVFYLHARLRSNWQAPKLNAVVLVGLATIMFTFLGVNQLAAFSESLHSYAAAG